MRIIFCTLLLFILSSCGEMVQNKNPLIIDINDRFDFENLKVGHIEEATDIVLKEADIIKNEIINLKDDQLNFENTLLRLDDLYAVVGGVSGPGYLMGSVHTDEVIRNEGLDAGKKVQNYYTDLSLNENLYNTIFKYSKTKEAKNLTGYKKKFLQDVMLDYKRSGFSLPSEKRKKVKKVLDRLTELGLEFDKNIRSSQDTLFLKEKELEGLPENYKKERKQADGTYAVDTSYPSYGPFMKLAESDKSREMLRFKYNNRASESNIIVLDDILRNRMKLVKLLGYSSYAEYRTEDRMAKNPKNVWSFENDLKDKLRPKALQDVSEMLKIKSKRLKKKAKVIHPWEAGFYENLLKLEKYDLDGEEVKKYFEFNNVTQGLFTIYQTLFSVRFERVENASVWHEDVQMFSVYDKKTDELIGDFYLDMFPRANKYSHAAAFGFRGGKLAYHL